MNWRTLAAACLTAGAFSLALVTGAGSAGPTAAPTDLKLDMAPRLNPKGAAVPGQFVLTAKLTTAGGKPVSNRDVRFYQTASLLGDRDAFAGSSSTDATGVAALVFQPAESGTITVKAQFTGEAQLAAKEVALSVPVANAVAPFVSEPLPLASVASVLEIGVVVVTLSVWAVLLGVLLRTTLRIRSAVRSTPTPAPRSA